MNCKDNIKIVSISTLVLLISFIVFAYIQYEEYENITVSFKNMEESVEEELEVYIESILLENQNKATIKVDNCLKNISNEIYEEYKYDFNNLEKDIKNPSEDTRLTKIIDKNLSNLYINKNTNTNKPVVISTDNVIWNRVLLYDYSEIERKDNIISLDEFISKHYNVNLSKQAMESILNMNESKEKFIFWEALESKEQEHKIIDDMDISELIDVYKKEGLDSLKSYELLIPRYITEDGDIFGNKDSDNTGDKRKTNKIIIIQRINVFDCLDKYKTEIDKFEDKIKYINLQGYLMSTEKASNMILCIIVSILTLITSAYIQKKLNE